MVTVQAESEQAIEEDLETFNRFFQALGNGPLTRYEVAAIKTYLIYKTRYEKKLEPGTPP